MPLVVPGTGPICGQCRGPNTDRRPDRFASANGDWSPHGAHLLLQIRTRVLNHTLADDYRRWYPGFAHTDWQDQAE